MLLFDKEFALEYSAREYMDEINNTTDCYADMHFDNEHQCWVVEVWR